MDHQKFDRQVQLEAESLNMGIVRYNRERTRKDESDLGPGKTLVSRSLVKMVTAIEEEIEALSSGKARRGRPSIYGQYMAEIDPSVQAFITAKVCINACTKLHAPFTAASIQVGKLCEEHKVFTDLHQTQPALFASAQRKVRKGTSAHYKRYTMRHAVRIGQEKHPDTVRGLTWSTDDQMRLGAKLIELFVEHTGLVEVVEERKGRKTTKLVRATEVTWDWLNRQHANREMLAPIYMPTIVPPKPWVTPLDGGYYTDAMRIPMVKTKRKGTIDELFSSDMPLVYEAINRLQDTAWKINKPVLDVVSELWRSNSTLGGLPSSETVPLPPKPENIEEMAKNDTEAFRDWKRERTLAYEANARESSRRVALAQQIFVAEKLRDEAAIYFPYQLDFRGRIYAAPTGLNPQVNDSGKGMLMFAEGKPLGEDGAFWLAVHIANLFGEDKISLEERVQWVYDNEEAILDSALSPLDGQRFWATADKPFCALAACYEWAGYKIEGDDYVSHLPIAMDGTCSGLQHYSALLRDPSGAGAVNLVPQEEPSDIYTLVAERVQSRVDASTDATMWKGKVTRKIVKQPCMTFAYSATVVGMRDQIVNALKKEDEEGNYLEGHNYFQAAGILAPIVREEIRKLVAAATAAMDWLQDCTKIVNDLGQPVVWWTPLGLPVLQANMKSSSKVINVVFQGQRMQLRLRRSTNKIDKRGQVNGIAPNYIHSLDSAHLMMTVLAASDMGIRDFAMIHDSFGTHACNTSELNYVLRQQFVEMYSDNLLEKFRADLQAQLPADVVLPPVPEMGDLDLGVVLQSDFFFS